MTFPDALSWLVGLSAVFGIAQNVRHFGFRMLGWLLVQAAILGVAVAGALLEIDALAYAAGALWVVFVLGPMWARRREQERVQRFDFDGAVFWARVAAWLHPFDDSFSQVTFTRAQGEVIRGHTELARALLSELDASPRLRDVARVEILRIDRDWRRIIELVEARGGALDARLVMPYLRALGETGDVDRLLGAYSKLPQPFRRLAAIRLVVMAYAGQVEVVQSLFEGPLARDSAATRTFWRAVAEQARGDTSAARPRLEALLRGEQLAEQARYRLLHPVRHLELGSLSAAALKTVEDIARDLREARAIPRARSRRALATYALMAVLALVFMAGELEGKNDSETLIRFGALVLPPERVGGGAAWRVVAAGFLHVNETHLVMNLLGLWVLGRAVERVAGPFAVLVAFLGSSIGAYTTALLLMPYDLQHPAMALGASAGVLGLVGAFASFAATGYLLRNNRLLAEQFLGIAFIVLVQLLFDHYHPGVSSFLHLAGAAWGAVLALPYSLRHFRRAKSPV